MRLFRLLPLMLFLLLCGCRRRFRRRQPSRPGQGARGPRHPRRGDRAHAGLDRKEPDRSVDLGHGFGSLSTADLPQGLRPAGTLSFTQQPTQTVWQKEAGDELRELYQIQLYQDAPYLTLTTLGLSLDVAISDQAAQELTHNLFP